MLYIHVCHQSLNLMFIIVMPTLLPTLLTLFPPSHLIFVDLNATKDKQQHNFFFSSCHCLFIKIKAGKKREKCVGNRKYHLTALIGCSQVLPVISRSLKKQIF